LADSEKRPINDGRDDTETPKSNGEDVSLDSNRAQDLSKKVITFGCRLNAYESEIIAENLQNSGLENAVVFNTCAVTKEAERQAKQSIRRYHRENPDSTIIVTGCGAQINPQSYAEIDGVRRVIDNESKLKADSYGSDMFFSSAERVQVNDIMEVTETAPHFANGQQDRARAFMQVQNGCDHRCTFCIIPYGRGNSRSVPVGEVVRHAEILLDQGYNEIVLTGVDMTSYGADLPGKPRLGSLVRRVLALVPDLSRVRLSSIDVAEVDDDLLWLIKNEPRFMPHLHLSLQAGDDMILKRMARRHTRKQAIDFCCNVKEDRPDIVFGADIITGFPTETEEMFENTKKMLEIINVPHLHVFPYSEREGTPAAKIPSNKQVPVDIRKKRAGILRDLAAEQMETLALSMIGSVLNVVVEKGGSGRTESFMSVKLEGGAGNHAIGSVVSVQVIDYISGRLIAVPIE